MPSDPSLGNLRPLQPPPTRWGIDHTQICQRIQLNAVEFATGWQKSRLVPSADFTNTAPLILYIVLRLGTPGEIISDNANCFTGREAQIFQRHYVFKMLHITPNRPQSNGKVKQANGILKGILTCTTLDNQSVLLAILLPRTVTIFNPHVAPSGYSPFFLLFGTQPPESEITYPVYNHETTDDEEKNWAKELVTNHAAPTAQSYVSSVKATRAKTREYLQESKALMRTFATGDWVLRVRQRNQKFEPFYNGPCAIAECHSNNTY